MQVQNKKARSKIW